MCCFGMINISILCLHVNIENINREYLIGLIYFDFKSLLGFKLSWLYIFIYISAHGVYQW